MDDKYDQYQFTCEERKEIINCVKNYFNLTKEERLKRRLTDFEFNQDEDKGWFQKWFSKNKIFPFLGIKVESWSDQLNNIDLSEIEQIYQDKNYYNLLPFKSSRTYTEEVMKKFLKNKSTNLIEPLKPYDTIIENEIIEDNETHQIYDLQTSSNDDYEIPNKSTRKLRKSNKERFEQSVHEVINEERSNRINEERSNRINEERSNQINEEKSNRINEERSNRINEEKCLDQSLIKQRLVKKRVWLNEQNILTKKLRPTKDINANYVNGSNESDEDFYYLNESYENNSSNLTKKTKKNKKNSNQINKIKTKIVTKIKRSNSSKLNNLTEFSDYEDIDQENNQIQNSSKELNLELNSFKNLNHQFYLFIIFICLSIFIFKFVN